MVRSYVRFLHRHRRAAFAALALVTLFFGVGLWRLFGGDTRILSQMALRHLRLQVDTSDDLFLPAHDEELRRYRDSTRIFGDDRFLIAILEFENAFTPDNLALIARLSESAGRGARRVSSLTHDLLYSASGKTLGYFRLGDHLPQTQAEADAVRDSVLSDSFLVHHLVSQDGKYAAIMVRTWPHVRGAQLDYFVKRFQQKIRMEAGRVPVSFAGSHVQALELHRATLRELRRLLPITAIIIGLFLFAVFRSVRGVFLPLSLMGLTLIWTFGLLGWIDRPVTPIDVILPTLLMTLCATYSLQFMTRHLQMAEVAARLGETPDRVALCEEAASDAFFPLFVAQATTLIGTAMLCLTDIPVILQFGLLSALGTAFTAFLIYTYLPLMLMSAAPRVRRVAPESRLMAFLADMSQAFHRNKTAPLIAAFGLTLLLSAGMLHLKVESDPKQFFKPDSPVRRAFAVLEDKMGGALSLSIVVDAGGPDALKDPETLRQIEALERYASRQPDVLRTLSFVDLVKRLNRAVHGNDPAMEKIPDTREEVSQILFLAAFGRDPSNMDRYVDYSYQRSRIEVRVKNVSATQTLALASNLQTYMDERWTAAMTGHVTGDHFMSCRANTAILSGQVKGFFGTAVAVFVVMWICFGSPKVGFLAMIPNVAPIGAVLGIMGYMGVQIDMATALLASVALGIALDDTIHFVVHYMRGIRTQPKGYLAIRDVVGSAGRAMVFTNVALALGFSVLLASDFPPVRMFGFFMIVAMAMACFDDFVMMPGLLGWIPLVGIWEHWRIKFKSDVRHGIPLFARLGVSDIKKIVSMGRLMTVPDRWPLMKEGATGDEMFVILEGSVTVMKSGRPVTELGRGETVGEMGLISEHPRSADVIVHGATTVFAFGYDALDRLERRYPRLATEHLK